MEIDIGFVAEGGAGERDIGEGVGDVTGARGGVLDGAGVAGEFAETLNGVVEADALLGGDVEDQAGDLFDWGWTWRGDCRSRHFQ